ncbi:MAG: STAS domain-containing protein [Victivallaceae bacterium]|nr:STAS domain-containing protein [Victivallaceae bacterium]
MQNGDLQIGGSDGKLMVKVKGRANFEYAVPLRELAARMQVRECELVFEMSECSAMDSTFMGVLSMLGLAAVRAGRKLTILNMPPNVRAMLRGLGVEKLFDFTDAAPDGLLELDDMERPGDSMLTKAETVVEAHQTLIDAAPENAAKFAKVIEFASSDLKNLREKENNR